MTPAQLSPIAQPARVLDPVEVVAAATELYLARRPIDMTVLARNLGVSRATLYRKVGKHDDLLGAVLAAQTELTFRSVPTPAGLDAVDTVCAVLAGFVTAVVSSAPLQALIDRDPVQFVRVVMGPGQVEDRGVLVVQGIIEAQLGGVLDTSAALLARTIVRVSDATMYTHLLQRRPPETDELLHLIRLVLVAATR